MSGVRFIYIPCVDLDAMRHFYSTLLALDEIYHSDDDGMVAYDCDGLQFSIFQSVDAGPHPEGWAIQPGWSGGTGSQVSWSVELGEAEFEAAVRRLQEGGVFALHEKPVWVSYWSFPVRDPMGNTVEVTYAPS